jgi:Tol biopolymer transport system component
MRYFLRLALVLIVLCAGAVVAARAAGGLLPKPPMLSFVSNMDWRHWIDIYVLDMERGVYANITRSPAFEQQPAWSRDGRLAYVSNMDGEGGIYIREANDSTHNIFKGYRDVDSTPLSWSMDGRLAFGARLNIYVLETNGKLHFISFHPHRRDFSPVWSPDSTLAFVSELINNQANVYLSKQNGEIVSAIPELAQTSAPAWTVGGELTFTDGYPYGKRYLIQRNDGSIKTILESKSGPILFPLWSPDGRLAFDTVPSAGRPQLVILEQNGDLHPLPNSDSYVDTKRAAWSLDGWFAYVSYEADFTSMIYVMNPDGKIRRVTPTGTNSFDPSWLP